MEYNYYILCYPDGGKQQIYHKLSFGDIVDINGNILSPNELDPYKITYKVSGMYKKYNFKEVYWFFKLDLMTRDEVEDEIEYLQSKNFLDREFLDKIFNKLSQKAQKNKKKR
ncbi:MAG TPA: hypothetical protein PLE45_12660 [Spirochaetota bacterium]|nr:hypothetical protein [Spirochaetota bacterium]HOL58187.1 hypothetical protein [Spirochaetota bacterium]HPP05631.1 hypothetical protein [Spirochaetota bacterium]